MMLRSSFGGLLSCIFYADLVLAQSPAPTAPGIISEGSHNTTVGGVAAARHGDRTSNGTAIVQGSNNVFINGKPVATVGDQTDCGGMAITGATGVFINGKPMVRAGDVTTKCPQH